MSKLVTKLPLLVNQTKPVVNIGFNRFIHHEKSELTQIKIPKRIPRDKTDILKALSSTVGTDTTAAHYKYIDDPYLIPHNRYHKLIYSLSKESGRKAAKYVMNESPQFFIRDEAEPKVEAFHFKELYDESMDLNEGDLLTAIKNNQIDNAMTAFKVMKSNGATITDDTKKSLLEIVCFFNSLEAPDTDLREKFVSERSESIWASDFAFEVFDSLSVKDSKAYSVMVAGLCKHSAIERALQLHDAAKDNNLSLTVEGYNALITIAIRGQSFENRWSIIMQVIHEMNNHKIAPNLETFANIFDIIVRCKSTSEVRDKAKGLMAEMKRCNIEPSLSVYNNLLRIFANGNNARPRILEEILSELGNKKLSMNQEKDDLFFSNAMSICNSLRDIQLAYKLHSLVSSHQNYLLLGSTEMEFRYYNNLFKLIVKSEAIDKTMEAYYKYVPNIYVPDSLTFIELIEAIELYQADRYMPQICSDFLLLEYYMAPDNITKFLKILSRREYPKEIQELVNNTVLDIMRVIQSKASQKNASELPNFDVAIFDYSLKILSNNKDFKKIKDVLVMLRQLKNSINGPLSLQTMNNLVDLAIELESGKDVIEIVKTTAAFGDISVLSRAMYLFKKKNASDNLIQRLEEIVSKNGLVLQDYSDESSESSESSDSSSDSSDDEKAQTGKSIEK